MNTADLISHLAADTRVVPRNKRRNDLAQGILAGAVVTLVATLFAFGLQSGLAQIEGLAPLLMKLAFVSALGIPAFLVVNRLAQPGVESGALTSTVAVPTLMLGALAILQVLMAPTAAWSDIILGGSWQECPLRIALLSLPILVGILIALRRQAPIELRRTGAVAGLLAGAMAAAIYALACTESTAAFVLLWYSCGIAVTTVVGGLLGPVALRW